MTKLKDDIDDNTFQLACETVNDALKVYYPTYVDKENYAKIIDVLGVVAGIHIAKLDDVSSIRQIAISLLNRVIRETMEITDKRMRGKK